MKTPMSVAIARQLRKSMTRQEVKLWVRLRELRTLGFHFRRQSPIARFIVDFECRRARLIVEVDGTQHGFDDHRVRDEARDHVLNDLGYRLLRFANPEIDRNMDGVLESILVALNSDLNELQPLAPPGALARATLPEDGYRMHTSRLPRLRRSDSVN
jgi:very-short-patch-repair endonuclease